MSRISIDVTDEEHKRLKAMAALKGLTLKEFLLGTALASSSEDDSTALAELLRELDGRIARAQKTGPSPRTVGEIFQQAYREAGLGENG